MNLQSRGPHAMSASVNSGTLISSRIQYKKQYGTWTIRQGKIRTEISQDGFLEVHFVVVIYSRYLFLKDV